MCVCLCVSDIQKEFVGMYVCICIFLCVCVYVWYFLEALICWVRLITTSLRSGLIYSINKKKQYIPGILYGIYFTIDMESIHSKQKCKQQILCFKFLWKKFNSELTFYLLKILLVIHLDCIIHSKREAQDIQKMSPSCFCSISRMMDIIL